MQVAALLVSGMLFVLIALGCTVEEKPEHNAHAGDDQGEVMVIENLRVFAKLFGYVRYFHPSDEAAAIDWEKFAVLGVDRVLQVTSSDELQQELTELFKPIAPTVQIYADQDGAPLPDATLLPDNHKDLKLVAWQHQGVDLGNSGVYQSVRLNRQDAESANTAFGAAAQFIDATPYRGKQIKLVAALKTKIDSSDSKAFLWLRVDRPDNQVGFFDNMGDRPVTAEHWESHKISGRIHNDAERIVFGGLFIGDGKAWFDDFQMYVRTDEQAQWTPVTLSNPSFEDNNAGEAPDGWIAQAEGYEFTVSDDASKGDKSLLIQSLTKERPAGVLFAATPGPGEVFERSLGRGLSAQVPLALFSRDGKTVAPENAPTLAVLEKAMQQVDLDKLTAEDASLRLANTVIAWNVFQHFYPYFDVIETNWDDTLRQTLQRAKADTSHEEFLKTLQFMIAQLHDGHGSVYHPRLQAHARLPVRVEWIENKITVVAVGAEEVSACMAPGDIVLALDGEPADDVLNDLMQYHSGTAQWRRFRVLQRFGSGSREAEAELKLDRQGNTLSCQLSRNSDQPVLEKRPSAIEEVEPEYFYVDLSRAAMSDIQQKFDVLQTAKGIIFDLRGYPQSNHAILQHLSTETIHSAHWQVPQLIYPDQHELVGYNTAGRWMLPPQQPHFQGKFVFLTDGRAISYAESILGIVEHYELAEIVGQPTAGANGNVNPFTLPGGYRINWTGMRVLKHDYSQHHLIGIQPTVLVERSLEAVQAGRDEYLEKALQLLKGD